MEGNDLLRESQPAKAALVDTGSSLQTTWVCVRRSARRQKVAYN
jgi:hypothetical protein